MAVKANQPTLQGDLDHLFADPDLVAASSTMHRTVDKGHGRLECRRLWASTALAGHSDWPALAQALCVEREVTILATGEVRRGRAYAVTSLPPALADARVLLDLWRGHWGIENRLHWVRDVGFDEDRSGATVGNGPQMLAALHNLTISLLRAHGHATIAAARRHLARAAADTLSLLGLPAQ